MRKLILSLNFSFLPLPCPFSSVHSNWIYSLPLFLSLTIYLACLLSQYFFSFFSVSGDICQSWSLFHPLFLLMALLLS